jgi:hypothetical protein
VGKGSLDRALKTALVEDLNISKRRAGDKLTYLLYEEGLTEILATLEPEAPRGGVCPREADRNDLSHLGFTITPLEYRLEHSKSSWRRLAGGSGL